MSTPAESTGENSDVSADEEIAACLSANPPRSFFLFAGAGSGKTRSLVAALEHIQRDLSETLKSKGQRVAVITYTNAASDEIKRRLRFDPLIDVRTIHSFAWSLIDGLNRDIRAWVRSNLTEDIRELEAEEAKGKKGTKASATRLNRIASKTRRLLNLDHIKRFVYSPTGDNRGRDALNHAEVLQLAAYFLTTKPSMRSILAGRFPILLIDESQDTNRWLIDAFFAVESALKGRFTLGLLGDMMQRIYFDGKDGLGEQLPADWAKPRKLLNHRCPKRVVTLINKIRSSVDSHQQRPRSDSVEGHVRLFLLPNDIGNKTAAERAVAERMAKVTGDQKWSEPTACKSLTLEHRMAASRMGFLDIFVPLYEVDSWRTSFLEGTHPASRFFARDVLPLLKAVRNADRFGVTRIVKALSPLLSADSLRQATDTRSQLKAVSKAIDELTALWTGDADPKLLQVLRCVGRSRLLEVPEILQPYADSALTPGVAESPVENEEPQIQSERSVAIEKFLQAPFSQVEPFDTYMSRKAHFDTHQGVKGLEFDRVMVIMDDEEARGFAFKYEDLFGGRPTGDKAVATTRRLFYVTCSRAKKSLALVAYTSLPERVKRFVLEQGWFTADELMTHADLQGIH